MGVGNEPRQHAPEVYRTSSEHGLTTPFPDPAGRPQATGKHTTAVQLCGCGIFSLVAAGSHTDRRGLEACVAYLTEPPCGTPYVAAPTCRGRVPSPPDNPLLEFAPRARTALSDNSPSDQWLTAPGF